MTTTMTMTTTTVPDIDSDIGILCYCTKFSGCGGKIRTAPGDFRVTEILSDESASSIKESGGYPVYSLTKTRIDTNHALSGIFRKTGMRLRSLGLKDSNAVTTQYVYSTVRSRGMEKFESERYALRRLGYTKKPLSKRHMIGNRFAIKVAGSGSDPGAFDEHDKILNFYGYQRFGSARPVTHLIGKSMVQKRYHDAVDYILSFVSKYDDDDDDGPEGGNAKIRREMADPSNYGRVYDRIPPRMDLERTVVSELIKHGDPLRAIRALPVAMRRFYVQAYQSYLFNLTLSRAFDCGEDLFAPKDGDVCYDRSGILGRRVPGSDQRLAIPVVGYSYYRKTRFDFYISKILREEETAPRDFYTREIQEASNEGGFRNSSVSVTGFGVSGSTASFTLSRGSFATIVMREIIKPGNPLQSGF